MNEKTFSDCPGDSSTDLLELANAAAAAGLYDLAAEYLDQFNNLLEAE